MAKSASIRRGRKLDQMEMQELIDKLFACEMPFSSPSGRKCVVKFDLEEIDKRFLI
jgi:DNA mismatch repair protein MutL